MKKRLMLLLTLIVLTTFIPLPVFADEEITVSAPSAILIDSKTGRVLYEKNADELRYPASTTKIMTGLLAIELGKIGDTVVIPNNIGSLIEKGSSQISLLEGEELTLEQLIYAAMLESANDAAIAIAQHLTGKTGDEAIQAFSVMMNDKAKKLGALNTDFQNPNGLDQNFDDHKTTARDLSTIARYAMTLPKFREVVATVKYTIPATNKQPQRDYIVNSNKMIWEKNAQDRYENCIGIKTGYTVKANSCFVAGAQKDDMELIAVVMGVDRNGSIYKDTKALFEFGFNNFTNTALIAKGAKVENTVEVLKGKEKVISLVVEKDLNVLLKTLEVDSLQKKIEVPPTVEAPVKKGDIIGTMSYWAGSEEVGKVNLLSETDILAKKFNLFKTLLIIILFIALILVLWIGFVAAYRKSNKGKKRYLIHRPKKK